MISGSNTTWFLKYNQRIIILLLGI